MTTPTFGLLLLLLAVFGLMVELINADDRRRRLADPVLLPDPTQWVRPWHMSEVQCQRWSELPHHHVRQDADGTTWLSVEAAIYVLHGGEG